MRKTLFTAMIATVGLLTSCGGGGGGGETAKETATLIPVNCASCELVFSPGDRSEGGHELVIRMNCVESAPGVGSGSLNAEVQFYEGDTCIGEFSMTGTWATVAVNENSFTISTISAQGNNAGLTAANMQFEITTNNSTNGVTSSRSGRFSSGQIMFNSGSRPYQFHMNGEEAEMTYTPRS